MELTWPAVVLLALLLLLNIISFVTLLVQREAAEQQRSRPEIIQIRNGSSTPNEYRRSMHLDIPTPSPVVLDRGKRIVWNGRDYHRLQFGQVIAKQHGNSLYVYDAEGGEQEYVKPCGSFVLGGIGEPWRSTFCVLPDGHCWDRHVDIEGNKKKVRRDSYGRD